MAERLLCGFRIPLLLISSGVRSQIDYLVESISPWR